MQENTTVADDQSRRQEEHAIAETVAPADTAENSPSPIPAQMGQYRILRVAGEGAMGVVYEAVDTNLNRKVAIKVLPEEFQRDVERASRFKREASVLASLNHPHIATVFNFEKLNDQHCIVMEFVAGQGLDEWLAAGGVNITEVLQIACQIASALEAAHNHGVIHRDLKPANIRITMNLDAKVLDFGLAKNTRLVDPQSGSSLPAVATTTGQIMGTPAYMSPEQARGRELDKRTDLWSFGCILFEMLSGHRAFQGETVTDTLVCIVDREPDWKLLPHDIPPLVMRVLERCLQKECNNRLPDVGSARLDMEEVLESTTPGTSSSPLATVAPRWRASQTRLIIAALLCAVIGIAVGRFLAPVPVPSTESSGTGSSGTGQSASTRPASISHVAVDLDQPISITSTSKSTWVRVFAVSPDGRQAKPRFSFISPDGRQAR